ncbi:MAG: diguanylate cyclase [Pseudomonadota bacterium]
MNSSGASSSIQARRDAAILIVDDVPANLGALRKTMISQGYQTFVATSGERALKIAQRVHPDLILLDVVMPGMDGFETCRRLKAHAGTERIPVIFMSANTEADDVAAGLDSGAVDYISKPLRMTEVCARVRTQLQLHSHNESTREQADHLRCIVDGMAEGLMIIEACGRIQYTNPACGQYLGYPGNALAGHTIAELLPPAVTEQCLDFFQACADNPANPPQHGAREVLIRHSDGEPRAMDLTLTPMFVREPLFIGLLHDITHHKHSETQLQRAALFDPLTKIANRRHFDTFMEKEWQRAIRSKQPLSLVVIDVDHFKQYNDTLGHPAGDACLLQVAQAIAAHALRPTDMAARYGGEEFVLLFAETQAKDALRLAEAIRTHVEELHMPHPRSSASQWITVSVGVATIRPGRRDEMSKLLIAADRAMYLAKECGRNRVQAARAIEAPCAAIDSAKVA